PSTDQPELPRACTGDALVQGRRSRRHRHRPARLARQRRLRRRDRRRERRGRLREPAEHPMTRRSLIPVCLASALVLAAPAFATIVPQHGMRGVTVGMSPAKVKAALGSPAKTTQGTNDFGHWVQYEYAGLIVGFQSGSGATSISTTSASEKTA